MDTIPDQPRTLDTREARRDAVRAYVTLTRDTYAALTEQQRAVILAELQTVATCDDTYQPRAYRGSMGILVRPGQAPEEHVASARSTLDRLHWYARPPIDNTPAGRAARLLAVTNDLDARMVLDGLPAATVDEMRQICVINGWGFGPTGWKRGQHVASVVESARIARIERAREAGNDAALWREYEHARKEAARTDGPAPTRTDMRPRIEVFRGRKLRTVKGTEWGTVSTFVNGHPNNVNATRFGSGPEGLDKAAAQLRRDVIGADETRITRPDAYPAEWFTGAPAPDPAVVAYCTRAAERESADRAAIVDDPTPTPAPDIAPMRSVADFRRAAVPGSRWQCVNHLHPNVNGVRVITGGTRALTYTGTKADGSVITNGRLELPKADAVRFDGGAVHFLYAPGDERIAWTWTRLPADSPDSPDTTPADPWGELLDAAGGAR